MAEEEDDHSVLFYSLVVHLHIIIPRSCKIIAIKYLTAGKIQLIDIFKTNKLHIDKSFACKNCIL